MYLNLSVGEKLDFPLPKDSKAYAFPTKLSASVELPLHDLYVREFTHVLSSSELETWARISSEGYGGWLKLGPTVKIMSVRVGMW